MKKNTRNSLVWFFLLAFLLPWFIWGTTIANNYGLISFHIPQSLAFWVGLTVAAYLVAVLSGGWSALKDLLLRMIRIRVKVVWYLVAFLFTAVVAGAAIGISLLFGGSPQIGVLLPANQLLPSLAFQIFFFWITEETAWRGFALPRLQSRFSALNSSLILGFLWGIWHLPLVFINGSFQSQVPFVGFVLSAVATSILMTWVFNHARGSVLVLAIFHAATDVTIAFLNVMSGARSLFWIFIALQWLVAIIVILVEGKTWLNRSIRQEDLPELQHE